MYAMTTQESTEQASSLPEVLRRTTYPVRLSAPWNEMVRAAQDEIRQILEFECSGRFALAPNSEPDVGRLDTVTWEARFHGWELPLIAHGYWQTTDAGVHILAHEEEPGKTGEPLTQPRWMRKSVYRLDRGHLVVRATMPMTNWDAA